MEVDILTGTSSAVLTVTICPIGAMPTPAPSDVGSISFCTEAIKVSDAFLFLTLYF